MEAYLLYFNMFTRRFGKKAKMTIEQFNYLHHLIHGLGCDLDGDYILIHKSDMDQLGLKLKCVEVPDDVVLPMTYTPFNMTSALEVYETLQCIVKTGNRKPVNTEEARCQNINDEALYCINNKFTDRVCFELYYLIQENKHKSLPNEKLRNVLRDYQESIYCINKWHDEYTRRLIGYRLESKNTMPDIQEKCS